MFFDLPRLKNGKKDIRKPKSVKKDIRKAEIAEIEHIIGLKAPLIGVL